MMPPKSESGAAGGSAINAGKSPARPGPVKKEATLRPKEEPGKKAGRLGVSSTWPGHHSRLALQAWHMLLMATPGQHQTTPAAGSFKSAMPSKLSDGTPVSPKAPISPHGPKKSVLKPVPRCPKARLLLF